MIRGTHHLLSGSTRAIATSRHAIHSSRRLPIAATSRRPSASSTISKSTPYPVSLITQTNQLAAKSTLQQGINPEEDKKAAEHIIQPNPDISSESTVRHVYEPSKGQDKAKPVGAGVKDDLETVKETFALSDVPKESYWLGLAGTLPYLGTSLSTVYLSWVLNTQWPSSSAFVNNIMISQDYARDLLTHLESLQLGYGAIIISFLGAIHWGLEYAEKTPDRARTRFRYGTGVLASVVAWPTLLMPVEFALTGQFAAFVALYFADARATVRGWAPSWYSMYRFALTAVVGVAIVLSLIGRAKVGDAQPRLSGLSEKFHQQAHGEQDYTKKWEDLENREREKLKKEKEEAEKKKKEEEKKAKAQEKKSNKSSDKGDKAKKDEDKSKDSDKKDESKEQQGEDQKEDDEAKDSGEKDKADQKGEDKKTDDKDNTDQKEGDKKSDDKDQADQKEGDKKSDDKKDENKGDDK
ncbi:hypothetical protein GGR57DRAFT_302961 [Xylariaceae sp. FL1272]|nr:hypothetical protein GGR57DRAFT_302961 [Xylariaceae sp. FL1272]